MFLSLLSSSGPGPVPVTHVESREMVARILGVEDVLIHHERRPPGLRGVAHSDLPDGPVLPENVVPDKNLYILGFN